MSAHTPGPWRYEPGGGHAYNSIRGGESVQVHGWPERINGIGNASYSDRICENLGDTALPGPAANARLIAAAPELLAALRPFAALLAAHHADVPDDRPVFGINDSVFTAGDLRAAVAAIARAEGKP